MKSGNLNFLEPSGPVQACNGTDLPFFVSKRVTYLNLGGSRSEIHTTHFEENKLPERVLFTVVVNLGITYRMSKHVALLDTQTLPSDYICVLTDADFVILTNPIGRHTQTVKLRQLLKFSSISDDAWKDECGTWLE